MSSLIKEQKFIEQKQQISTEKTLIENDKESNEIIDEVFKGIGFE
jgi:hypothetical protein